MFGLDKTIGAIESKTLATKWTGSNLSTSQKRTFSSTVRAAGSIFKKEALEYYADRKIPLENPFKNLILPKAKPAPYVPLPKQLRQAIWQDCQQDLSPENAMIVLGALGAGLRLRECEKARGTWFSEQSDKVLISVQAESDYIPKSGENGVVPITRELYHQLLKLREDSTSPKGEYFFPSNSSHTRDKRLAENTRIVNAWLKNKGVIDRKPIHSLRKECGAKIAQEQSILAASKILRNTVQVCIDYYAGIAEVATVDMAASFKATDPLQTVADQLGISLEEAKKRLGVD